MAAERPADPFHGAALLHHGALRVEVVHVLRPVLDRGVAQGRALAHEQLHGAGVQVRHVVLRCRAALDEVQAGVVLHDDQRVLELSCALRVQAEVALQGEVQLHALRHVDERAAAPHRAVKRGELVVGGRDQRHELLSDERLPLRLAQRLLDAGIDDPHVGSRFLHVVVHQLGVVLRADAGQVGALGLRDAQPVERVLHIVGEAFPIGLLVGGGLHVRHDVIHVEAFEAGAPVGRLHALVGVERLEAEVEHPGRLVLLGRDLADDVGREACVEPEGRVGRVADVVQRAVDVLHIGSELFSHACLL